MRNGLKLLMIFSIFFSGGCGYIATREDVDITKEKIEDVETGLKNVNEKFVYMEKDYNQKIEKLNRDVKDISDKILVITNEMNNLKEEIKIMRGKIDEVKFEYDGRIKKTTDEFIEKNLEIKREIEGLKKTYNDLITTTSSINKSFSVLQTDILNLRNSQTKVVENFQDLLKRLEQINERIDKIEKKLDSSTGILLEELTRHESEIYYIKKQISNQKTEISKPENIKSILKPEKEKYYIVQKGDYLTKIAKKFNTSVDEIKKINNLKSDTVYPGQKLLIP